MVASSLLEAVSDEGGEDERLSDITEEKMNIAPPLPPPPPIATSAPPMPSESRGGGMRRRLRGGLSKARQTRGVGARTAAKAGSKDAMQSETMELMPMIHKKISAKAYQGVGGKNYKKLFDIFDKNQ